MPRTGPGFDGGPGGSDLYNLYMPVESRQVVGFGGAEGSTNG